MKKVYTKPEIFFDSFELSQSIAAGCELISNHAVNVCKIYDNELGLVYLTQDSCADTPPGDDDGLCYDVPVLDWGVYSS